jgi:hypothetical protein
MVTTSSIAQRASNDFLMLVLLSARFVKNIIHVVLLPQNLLDLADLFLNSAGYLFNGAFS